MPRSLTPYQPYMGVLAPDAYRRMYRVRRAARRQQNSHPCPKCGVRSVTGNSLCRSCAAVVRQARWKAGGIKPKRAARPPVVVVSARGSESALSPPLCRVEVSRLHAVLVPNLHHSDVTGLCAKLRLADLSHLNTNAARYPNGLVCNISPCQRELITRAAHECGVEISFAKARNALYPDAIGVHVASSTPDPKEMLRRFHALQVEAYFQKEEKNDR